MKKFLLVTLTFLLILSACSSISPSPILPTTGPSAQPTPEPAPLERGINMGNMLEAPNEGEWGLVAKEEYFEKIKGAGFDFVRLPVRWNAHAEESAPYTIDPAFFSRVDEVVGWALKNDLRIIVNIHHYEEMVSDPWGHETRFIELWRQIADHYKGYPPTVLFELLNEPYDQLDAAMWNKILGKTLKVVRETNPTRDVVLGPVNWNSYEWVSTLDTQNDTHVIVTFHYYLPFEFTHQGADWVGEESKAWLGNTWEGTPDQQAEIKSHFDSVADWAKRNQIRILLGEFGSYHAAPQDSRLRWTTFVREQAESHGFAWSYWEFGSGFGAYDPEVNAWREDLLKTLIP